MSPGKRSRILSAAGKGAPNGQKTASTQDQFDFVERLERGPVFEYVVLEAVSPAVIAAARLLWNETHARLKLVLSGAGDTAEYEVPGGTVVRGALGEVPGGRWVRSGRVGFASDALYGFNLKNGKLQAAVCRGLSFAEATADPDPWKPIMDRGELSFRFLVTGELPELPRLAAELEQPPVALVVPAKAGAKASVLGRTGSLLELMPASLELLALKPAADGRGIVLRVRETSGRRVTARARWLGKPLPLGPVAGHAIATWRLTPGRARPVTLTEL